MPEFTAKVRKKGEVTIPLKLREIANIEAGDILEIVYTKGKIICTHYQGKH